MASTDTLEDLLFTGLSERPIWSGFLRTLAHHTSAERTFLAVEGSKPHPDEVALVLPEPGSADIIDLAQRFGLLQALDFAAAQLICTNGWTAAIIRCAISGGRSIWLIAEGPYLDGATCTAELQRLSPLLCRVLPLYELLADTVREHRVAEYVIEAAGTGTILVDADGRVMSANAVATALIAEGGALKVVDGAIHGRSKEATQHLREAIAAMSKRQSPQIDPYCYLPIALPDPARLHPLTLLVRPGPPYGPVSAPLKRTAIIVIRDPARPALLAVSDVERLFGLSPAEARLATRLVDGEALDEAALGLGISRNTARSQLQSIYMKTGVNRQGDLVRLLLSSAASQVGDPPATLPKS